MRGLPTQVLEVGPSLSQGDLAFVPWYAPTPPLPLVPCSPATPSTILLRYPEHHTAPLPLAPYTALLPLDLNPTLA
eukprot:3272317-Rhodomonas_salina.1